MELVKLTILNNKHCNISLTDNALFKDLRYRLSYKMIGVEYTQAFKNGWDGITYLLDKKGNFPLGLINRVEKFLNDNKINYEIVDKRKVVEIVDEINITDTLKSLKKEPRDYQLAMVEAAFNNRKGIIRAATGSGKSITAALITAKFNKPTIIYVIGLDLLQQFHKLFSEIFQTPIGFIGNGVCDIQNINIASIWTIGKALDIKFKMFDEEDVIAENNLTDLNKFKIQKLLKSTELHIIDECHSATCDTIKEIYKNIDPKFIYGMSATPNRGDGQDLYMEGILGNQIINISASTLIDRKVLAQPIIKFIDVPSLPIYSKNYSSIYSEYIVENEIRNNLIVIEAKKLLEKGYQTLILFKQIKHGKLIQKMLLNDGIDCPLLDGNNSLEERNEIKEQLLSQNIKLVLASTIYDLGVDVASLSGLILAGGGNSHVRAIQRIGRVIRAFPGKNVAAIVDFYDQARFVKKHSIDRYKYYSQEPGFDIRLSKLMKKHLCL